MKLILYSAVIMLLVPVACYGQFLFEDATAASKINQQSVGTQNIGPGVVVFDFDNDGWEDLYLPGGLDSDRLFRNNHDGTFTDISDSTFRVHSGFRVSPRGGTAFDFDNDGWTDIYVCTEGDPIFWKNNGDGTFTDVIKKTGMVTSLDRNESNGASFGDFNGDGYNDLYVARWINEAYSYKDSNGYHYANKGFPNWFYVNNGDGTFTERAKEFGVDGDTGTSNIALFFDYDRDGDLDILVGNDFGVQEMPNRVFKNRLMETGKATFVDMTDSIGLDQHLFCMGIGPNDYDRDGDFDFYETTVGPQRLMQNNNNIFTDVALQTNLPDGYLHGNKDSMTTTWTALFADFDNNGWEDGYIVHGYIGLAPPWNTLRIDTSVFLRNMGGTFQNVTSASGVLFTHRGKGAALTDFDHDGKVDIVLGYLGVDDPPGKHISDFRLYHNITPSENSGHWLQMKFTAKRTAKEGIGTIVDVWAGGAVRSRQVSTGGGQASCNSLVAYVGLGKYTKADSVNVFWPADKFLHRQIDHYYNIAADHLYHITENMTDHPDTTLLEGVVPVLQTQAQAPAVYPNPARNVLNIENLQASISKRFEIYDLLGIRQSDVTGTESAFSLSVGNLKPGCYVLRITTSGNSVTKQFIKE